MLNKIVHPEIVLWRSYLEFEVFLFSLYLNYIADKYFETLFGHVLEAFRMGFERVLYAFWMCFGRIFKTPFGRVLDEFKTNFNAT